MKRLFFIATVLLSALLFGSATECFSQNEHLKFAGIPLDGTISQFHQKLVAKGYKYDVDVSKQFDDSRVYSGIFAGETCRIYVFYDTKTKIVYRAKAVVVELSESVAEQKFDNIKSRLCAKYTEDNSIHDNAEGSKFKCAFSILPLRENLDLSSSTWKNAYGIINIYVTKIDSYILTSSNDHSLHIDYEDQINSDAHEKNVEDDL